MTVYQGSNVEVKVPMILKPNRALDFGNGFNTTTNHDQEDDPDQVKPVKGRNGDNLRLLADIPYGLF